MARTLHHLKVWCSASVVKQKVSLVKLNQRNDINTFLYLLVEPNNVIMFLFEHMKSSCFYSLTTPMSNLVQASIDLEAKRIYRNPKITNFHITAAVGTA